MIVSRYFQEAKYAERLRSYLSQTTTLVHLVDFQNFQVFGTEVNVLASIVILKKPNSEGKKQVHVMRLTNDKVTETSLSAALHRQSSDLFDLFDSAVPVGGEVWNFKHLVDAKIFDKLTRCSLPLSALASIVQSMQTGLNEVLAPSFATLIEYSIELKLVYPIAKAGSIQRFEFEQLQHAIIWTEGIEIDDYPNAKRYLLPFKEFLAARYDIKSRKAKWWEISNPRNAELFFGNQPRILVPFIATGNKFCVDDEKRLNDGGDIRGIFIKSDCQYSEHYICALLNSQLCEYYHLRNTKLKEAVTMNISKVNYQDFPSVASTSLSHPKNAPTTSKKPKTSTNTA